MSSFPKKKVQKNSLAAAFLKCGIFEVVEVLEIAWVPSHEMREPVDGDGVTCQEYARRPKCHLR